MKLDPKFLFGQKVKAYRKSIGLSQESFGLKIGLDRTYIASIEAGKRNVSLLNICKIASGLNISVSTLLEGI